MYTEILFYVRWSCFIQLPSHVILFETPWIAAHQASLSLIISWSVPKFMSIKLVIPSNHLILCCPLLLLPSIFLSIRVFSNELALCISWPGFWGFNFSILPSNEYLWLISFKIDWFDSLLSKGLSSVFSSTTVQKASILQCCAFFMVQFSQLHDY